MFSSKKKGGGKKGVKTSRNELFEGSAYDREAAAAPEQQLSVDELVRKAERTHKDTTTVTRRALRVCSAELLQDADSTGVPEEQLSLQTRCRQPRQQCLEVYHNRLAPQLEAV